MAQPSYYTNIGDRGAVKHNKVSYSIGVLESPHGGLPIGVANCVGEDVNGLAIWELTVRGERIPGRWLIVDGEFGRVH
jgi:hypothetical protein